MGGALLQLAAYGAQDIYLTGKPQMTFFKSVYRRHTNFAIESVEQLSDESPQLDTRITYVISRNGDLLKRLWIQFSPYNSIKDSYSDYLAKGVNISTIASDFGHAILDQIEIEIGGQIIDRHYGKWLSIWRDLTEINPYASQGALGLNGLRKEQDFDILYNKMAYTHVGIARSPNVGSTGATGLVGVNLLESTTEAYIPLQFWFCKNPGLALPLIALQYHEIKLNINISNLDSFLVLYNPNNVIIDNNIFFNISKSFKVFGDYVYLDSSERKQFVNNSHEYLIEQLQRKTSKNTSNIKLTFNHPIKELIFSGQPEKPSFLSNYNQIDQYSTGYTGIYDPTSPYFQNLSPPFSWYYTCDGTATPRPILTCPGYLLGEVDTLTWPQQMDASSITEATVQILLNGKEQFVERNLKYFTRKELYTHHTGRGGGTRGTIGVYSFALNPENQQPSGFCNLSVYTDARIIFKNLKSYETLNALDIYAVNYNIFKVIAGQGGIMYSN